MRYLPIAALALVATPSAANADWGPTRWGMTPEQVIAITPNAAAVPYSADMSVADHHMLASAPTRDGKIGLSAHFYFEPKSHTLGFIQFVPREQDCKAYIAQLETVHGKGQREDKDLGDLLMTTLNWTDPATQERLSATWVMSKSPGNESMYCHYMQQAPA